MERKERDNFSVHPNWCNDLASSSPSSAFSIWPLLLNKKEEKKLLLLLLLLLQL
jgi:hypothetical protein